jgi:hypothetical protein
MARTEAAILADMSNTNAAIARIVSATGAGGLGDFSAGNLKMNRAASIGVLEARITRLQDELNNCPAESITTMDFEWDAQGGDQTEYVEET